MTGLYKRGPNRRKAGQAFRRQKYGYLFSAPCLLILAGLVAYPLLYGFYISFFKTNLIKKWTFVGLKYYQEALQNLEFLRQLVVTFKFTILVVLGHFLIGMVLAVLLNREFKGRMVFRVILLLPWLFPESVIALLFKWIFNPLYGIFNWFLMEVGVISQPQSWLGDGAYAFWAVVFVCIWKGYPMIMMMLMSGLQTIPGDLYEAARIDGADSFRAFWKITLPNLRPVLIVTLILDTVWWFKHYTLVYVLTGGGPGNTTSLISISIYKEAFDNFNFGSAAAQSVIVFSICFVLAILYRKILEKED